MDDRLNLLLKTDDQSVVSLENSKKYNNTKRRINAICKELSQETKDYKPEETAKSIQDYIDNKDKMGRLLYSEISSYIFSMDMKDRGAFATNVEKLMIYALSESQDKITDDCSKMIIKIYDHFQLALSQIENIETRLAPRVEDAKIDLRKEIKGIEREYISILGIFASIILTFVGGITFSSSVLQNMNNVSIYRLLAVAVFLAFILIDLIWMLIKFITEINDKKVKLFDIKLFNMACVLMEISIAATWTFNMHELSEFFKSFLPWCK